MQRTNSNTTHDYYQSLLGAYALDALDDDEQRALEEHLRGCQSCREELALLLLAAGELPLLANEAEPSANLRARIYETAQAEPQVQGTVRPETSDIPPTPLRPASRRGAAKRLPDWSSWLAAAVLLVAAIGLLIWNLQLRNDAASRSIETIALQGQGGASVVGELIYLKDRKIGVLQTQNLPPLKQGQVYQMWLIRDSVPAAAGVFTSPAGELALNVDLAQYQAFALTTEPGPTGSIQPTSDPFAIAPLNGT